MRQITLLIAFFISAPALLILSGFFLLFLNYQQKTGSGFSLFSQPNKSIAYAALPSNLNVVDGTVGKDDVRIGKVAAFLQGFNSPLTEYAGFMVNTADKYGVDYRMLPAIGAQESGDCTKGKSTLWKNCWGFGIYGGKITQFDTYSDAIDRITRYIANKKSGGIDTLDELGSIYNPTDHNNWKENVASFMNQL